MPSLQSLVYIQYHLALTDMHTEYIYFPHFLVI